MTRICRSLPTLLLVFVGRAPAAAEPSEQLYLELYVNDNDQHLIVELERRADRLFIALDELVAVGIRVGDLEAPADGRIAVDAIPGVRYQYVASEQLLEIVVAPSRLIPDLLGYNVPSTTVPRSGKGLVLNYALSLQSQPLPLEERATRLLAPLVDTGYGRAPRGSSNDLRSAYEARNHTATLDADLRFFAPFGLLVDRGYVTQQDGKSTSVRYDTYWT